MTYESEKGNFTIALAGDTMLTRKLTPFKEDRISETARDFAQRRCRLRQSRRHGP